MRESGIYILMISVHGLIRGVAPELGRDPDTGGQVLYVLELAKALDAAFAQISRASHSAYTYIKRRGVG